MIHNLTPMPGRLFTAVMLLLSLYACEKADPKPKSLPVVVTGATSQVSSSSCTAEGQVISDGNSPVTERGIVLALGEIPDIDDQKVTSGSGLGSFQVNITGLQPGKNYRIRAYAINALGVSYGVSVDVNTSAVAPAVTTVAASGVTSSTGVISGSVTADGGASVQERGLYWSTTPNSGTSGTKAVLGTGTGTFETTLSSLQPNTSYYYKAYAVNSAGTSFGTELTFKTLVALPVITTTAISDLTHQSLKSGGTVTDTGGGTVSARGIVWSATPGPTVSGNKTTDGNGAGSFVSTLSALQPETRLYIRAYATNEAGTGYGQELTVRTKYPPLIFNSSLTYGSVTDIDGNVYKTIPIGSQVWMAENLKTTKYNDGSAIPLIENDQSWEAARTPAYCWFDNDPATYKDVLGALYNFYTVNTGKLCPTGWKLPSITDYQTLLNSLPSSNPGVALKETTNTHWLTSPNTATNSTGFTAVPAGYRVTSISGISPTAWGEAYWWTSTPITDLGLTTPNRGYVYVLTRYNDGFGGQSDLQYFGHSVRCIQE